VRLTKAILVRLLFGLFSLIFISFITFAAGEFAPGDRATAEAGEKARPETLIMLRHRYGLDRPWPYRYVTFLSDAARFDFGNSYVGTKQPVSERIAKTAPMTLKVALAAMLIAVIIGLTLGTIAAVWQGRFLDGFALSISTLGVTLPNFVLIPILVYVFAFKLDYLPQTWEVQLKGPEYLYLILPVVALALRPMALLTRLTRASLIETMQQEFMRTAVAKGVPFWSRILKHGLRNAILPVITAIGTSFGFLLTGSFVVERAFVLPGLGSAGIEAIQSGDTPMIQATVLLAGATFIIINLLVDLLLPLLDPRIREAQV
jgi:peptide/nickel transport system permease protein